MGTRRICSVCCQAVAAYTCPRCHKAYCTSTCYKEHGQTCTEAFYKEQATSHMKAMRADAGQKQQMMEILQRLHDNSSQDTYEDDVSSSEEGSDADEQAAAGVDALLAQSSEFQQLLQKASAQGSDFNIDAADVSPELLSKMEALCASGRLSHLIAPWQPWWHSEAAKELTLNATGQRVVIELHTAPQPNSTSTATAAAHADDDGSTAVPPPPEQPLPSLAVLAGPKFKPSPLLPWQLLQLLVAYCAIMRRWNGEPDCRSSGSSTNSTTGQGWEAAEQLLLLAPPLTQLVPTANSSSASRRQQTVDEQQQETNGQLGQQQHAQQQGLHESELQAESAHVVADSVRCACMQLSTAGAAADSELRALLPLAESDAGKLLELGRHAVLLALTDCWRLLQESKQFLKQHRQRTQKQVQRRHNLQQRQSHEVQSAAGGMPKQGTKTAHSYQPCNEQQHQQQMEQHLKLAVRKLYFFMVWSSEQPAAMYERLAFELTRELQEQQDINSPAPAGISFGVQAVDTLPGTRQSAASAEQRHGPAVLHDAAEQEVLKQPQAKQQHLLKQQEPEPGAVQRKPFGVTNEEQQVLAGPTRPAMECQQQQQLTAGVAEQLTASVQFDVQPSFAAQPAHGCDVQVGAVLASQQSRFTDLYELD